MLDIVNPFNQQSIAQLPFEDCAQIQEKITKCQHAGAKWRQCSLSFRIEVLLNWQQAMVDRKFSLCELLSKEQGKDLEQAASEVDYALSYITYYCDLLTQQPELLLNNQLYEQVIETQYLPLGVCALITPWNFPVAMLVRKLVPALLAGNTVIAKPSEYTPLSAMFLYDQFQELCPISGVFVLSVSLGADFSQQVARSPWVKKVSFTGSTAVGEKVMQVNAKSIKRLSLELGGDSPFIVTSTAKIDLAVAAIMQAKFRNSGQSCVALNQLYVHESVMASLLVLLKSALGHLKCGPYFEAGVNIGPLIHPQAVVLRQSWIDEAVSKGARILWQYDLEPDKQSQFIAPVLITDVPKELALATEELFAPILVVQVYSQLVPLIERLNERQMGLAGYVFSHDLSEIQWIKTQLEVGMLAVNTAMLSDARAPFGGVNMSGFGREGGVLGLREYQRLLYCKQYSPSLVGSQ